MSHELITFPPGSTVQYKEMTRQNHCNTKGKPKTTIETTAQYYISLNKNSVLEKNNELEAYLHYFLNSALDGYKTSASCQGSSIAGKEPPVHTG